MNPRLLGILLLLAAATLWSLSGVAVKVLRIDAPVSFVSWRSLGAALTMLAILPFGRGRWPPAVPMGVSVLLFVLTVTLLFVAMTAATAARGILLQYTGPVYCALFGWLLLERRLSPRTMLAMLLCGMGIGIMLAGADTTAGWLDVGTLSGLASGVTFGGLILALEWIDRARSGVDPIKIVLLLNGISAAAIALVAATLGMRSLPPPVVGWVLLLGAVQIAAPYLLFQLALRRVSAVDASLTILLEPVLNPVWVWLAVGEAPETSTLWGGLAIVAAMVVEATKGRRDGEASPVGTSTRDRARDEVARDVPA